MSLLSLLVVFETTSKLFVYLEATIDSRPSIIRVGVGVVEQGALGGLGILGRRHLCRQILSKNCNCGKNYALSVVSLIRELAQSCMQSTALGFLLQLLFLPLETFWRGHPAGRGHGATFCRNLSKAAYLLLPRHQRGGDLWLGLPAPAACRTTTPAQNARSVVIASQLLPLLPISQHLQLSTRRCPCCRCTFEIEFFQRLYIILSLSLCRHL